MLFLYLLISVSKPMTIPELKKMGLEIGEAAYKKKIDILKKHPEYRKYFWRPARKPFRIPERNLKLMQPETLNVLVLRVQFLPDDSTDPLDSLTTGNGRMQYTPYGNPCDTVVDSLGDTTYQRNIYYDPPHDSLYFHHLMEYLHNYYWEVSHHLLYIKYKIYPIGKDTAYTVPHKESYYGNPDLWIVGLFSLLRDAIQVADRDPVNIDFSDFDRVIIFHAGSMWQTDIAGDTPYDLPAVFIDGADEVLGEPIYANNKTDSINSGVIYAETGFQDGYAAFLQGGLCHEFGHTLGFLDLYDISGATMGMGGWALMGTGNWNMDGLVPPRVSGWHRLLVGFDDTLTVHHDTTGLSIYWTGSNYTPRLIKVPINSHEYFLIENRFTYMNPDTFHYVNPCNETGIDSNGFRVWKDNVLTYVNDYEVSLPPDPNSGGLAIYHVDDAKIAKYDTFNMINVGYPLGVDMEEADGIQDFERPFSEGFISDREALETFYGSPYDVFSSYGRLDSFTQYTNPSTDDNEYGKTYISIYGISRPGTVMHFSVKFNNRVSGFPVKVLSTTDVISPMPVVYHDSSYILQGTYGGDLYLISPNGYRKFFAGQPNNTYSTPAIGDLNNDGYDEVVSCDLKGKVYVWTFNPNLRQKLAEYQTNGPIYGSPSIADIDGDSINDILVGSDDGYLYALSLDTTRTLKVKQGFPVYIGQSIWSVPVFYNGYIYVLSGDGTLFKVSPQGKIIWRRGKEDLMLTTTSPVIGDIDGDGTYEVMYVAGNGKVWCISTQDNTQDSIKWVYQMRDTSFVSSPAIGDIDGDGYPELVFAGKDMIYALNKNGFLKSHFPVKLKFGDWIQSSIVLADMDDDGRQDIVFGSPTSGVHILNWKGKEIDISPISSGMTEWSTPLIYNTDGDSSNTEIFFGGEDSLLHGYRFVSHLNSDWPMEFLTPAHQPVLLKNFNNNNGANADTTLFYHERFYIYPSPITGNNARVRYYLGEDANNVDIKIFNIAGDLIKHIKGGVRSGINEESLDFSNIANGVYIVTITVDFPDGRVIRDKKRFAIMKGGFIR